MAVTVFDDCAAREVDIALSSGVCALVVSGRQYTPTMTAAAGTDRVTLGRVVEAATSSWAGNGYQVRVDSNPSERGAGIEACIVVPSLRQVECVFTSAEELELAAPQMVSMRDGGWGVVALLPVSGLGLAHETLSGLDVGLQGWLIGASERVEFTGIEKA